MATTSSSPLDLLMPDPTPAKPDASEDEEEDLEALRQAALASMMKPKAQAYKVGAHPNRSNLLCIVVEDPNAKSKVAKEQPKDDKNKNSPDSKFDRFESSSSEEEEEVEVETEVEVTDSETEPEPVKKVAATAAAAKSESGTPKPDEEDELNINCSEEIDEFSKFLNDFETELKGSESEPKDQSTSGSKEEGPKLKKKKKVKVKKMVKRKIPRRKTMRLEDSITTTTSSYPQSSVRRSSRSYSRSPSPYRYGRRYSRSPYSPYRPLSPKPLRRSRSPYARGISPPFPRRYSPTPYYSTTSPPPYHRPGGYISPPYLKRHSPPRSQIPPPHRRYRSPRGRRQEPLDVKFGRRGDSAPRSSDDIGAQRKRQGSGDKDKADNADKDSKSDSISKSKSLPPKNNDDRRAREREERKEREELRKQKEEEENRKKEEEKKKKDEEKEKEFQERLKRLPTPDRERVLARRRKFESAQAVQAEKKVISLKNAPEPVLLPPLAENTDSIKTHSKPRRMNSEDLGDSISLSVEDTLDMFEEMKPVETGRITKGPEGLTTRNFKRDRELPTKGIVDLRLQITKKQKHNRDKRSPDFNAEPKEVNDSLENAVVEFSDEMESDDDEPKSKLSSNRIVKPPGKEFDRRILIAAGVPKVRSENVVVVRRRGASPTMLVVRSPSKIRPSIMSRLGEQIMDDDDVPKDKEKIIRKRKKHSSSGRSESPISPSKVNKREKKKDKKEKKKSKKEKKEKREKRKKRKSKVSESNDDDDNEDDENNIDAKVVIAEKPIEIPEDSSADEELWEFFENMDKVVATVPDVKDIEVDKSDILMDKMKKKNEARLKRLKEIEEDRILHQ